MVLWLIFAVLTAGVLIAVLAPLARPAGREQPQENAALGVYRHQLDELEAERARGVIEEAEAAAAKVEISRRLLASAPGDRASDAASPASAASRGPVALAIACLVPLLTLGLYLAYGSPGLPSFPISGRAQVPLEQAQLGDLIAKVEARLREHPDDGEGWDVIAPVYFKLERFRDAANAYARAGQLKGESIKRLAGFAEASVLAADGIVTEDARLAYEKIRKLEPARIEPRFWLALAKEQDGKLADALTEYRGLLAEASIDAPWRGALEQRIADVSRRLSDPDKPQGAGPSAGDVAAAQKLPAEQQAQMIARMVDGLAERLHRDGNDLAGWLRLVRAYSVLDRKGDARAALSEARRHFSGDKRALDQLSALAASLGLDS
jgi:cytochrome c-type biogenesis protein CcmH